jgi:hypothetical protein
MENSLYATDVSGMTLEGYIKFFNEALYPINYPYKLRYGLRAESKVLSIVVQVHIDNDEDNIPIFRDILIIEDANEKALLGKIRDIRNKWMQHRHLEDYKDLWNI